MRSPKTTRTPASRSISRYENSVCLEGAGHVFLAEHFNGTADFDPGAGVANLTSAGNADMFIARYDTNGAYQMAVRIGNEQRHRAAGHRALRCDGQHYMTGKFRGMLDHYPGHVRLTYPLPRLHSKPPMTTLRRLLSLAFAAVVCSAAHARTELALVQQGHSRFVIVHAADAPGTVRTAARELQSYVEKVAGAKLPIISGDAPAQGPFVALGDTPEGRAAGISVKNVPLEGYRLVSSGGNLFIAGPDTRDKEMTPEGGTSTGTLNGVYTFIEDYLDVRWLLPGPLGEDVPSRSSVLVAAVNRTEQPGFRNRRVPSIQTEQPAVQEWSARQKLGFSMKLEHSHNWQQVVPAALHEQHPDWFPEVDGKHPPVVGDRYKLETTNPGLIQHYAQAAMEAFRKNPKLPVFSLSPTDSDGWSTSAESKALYDRDPRGKRSVTPLVLKFYNDVAKLVGKEFPDRKLAGYVYASYLYPPSAGVPSLEPNLFLVVAPSISYGYQLYRKGVKEEWESLLKAWSTQTSQIAYYDLFNWLKGSTGAITPPAPEILNFAFPRLVKYGIKGIYIYGTAEWSQAAVNNYVLARMAWNPALDANAVCDEFYLRAYGPAAGERIRKIHHLVDDAVKVFYNQDPTANYTATPRYQSEVLAANYAKIEALYLDARLAATTATPAQHARLEFFGDNLVLMQSQLRASGFLPETKTSPLYRADAEVDQMLGRLHPAFGVEFAPKMKRIEKPFPPVQAAWSPALPHPLPVKPLGLRGLTRFLCFPNADQDITVTLTKIVKAGTLVRYDAYTAAGAKLAGGTLHVGIPVQFLSSTGQIYYVEIKSSSPYEVELKGAPYAIAADAEPRGLHLGKPTALYFQVPAGVPQFTLSVSSEAPGETSLSQLFAPSGKLVQTLDTQTERIARATIIPAQTGGEWAGFWCLSIEKAPKGSFDDVFVSLDSALPQWFTLDPAQPLTISAVKGLK